MWITPRFKRDIGKNKSVQTAGVICVLDAFIYIV